MERKSDLCKDCSGFTLIEVIVVCGIIAILGSITVAGFATWLPNYELSRAVRELYSSMQQAKMVAIKEQRNCGITYTGGADPGYAVTGVTRTIVFSTEYSRGVRFSGPAGWTTPANGYDPGSITFNARGGVNEVQPANGYWAYISNTRGTNYYRVGPRSTGVIRLQKWISNEWKD